ncbi:HNH endonuclease [Sanguibacter sp. A247]|uniref:HNH endonuclease n=1 Tax=unclassified Sanguibacter TaxID=2645534 RepID=UPI003FD76153
MPPRTRVATYARRRKRRLAAVTNDLTGAQWADIVEMWGGCAYCGADDVSMQKDCVLPISRGGRYTATNVVPACRSCNASKCNDEVTGWMRRKKLDERKFLGRWAELLRSVRTVVPDDSVDAALGDPTASDPTAGA